MKRFYTESIMEKLRMFIKYFHLCFCVTLLSNEHVSDIKNDIIGVHILIVTSPAQKHKKLSRH
jgi:hypothetical protein